VNRFELESKGKGVERTFNTSCQPTENKGIVAGMERGLLDERAVREQLERILSSAVFSRNERLSRFLRFVVEKHLAGKEGELKESVIAIEVCRKWDYDSKLDSIVRTEAGRLRARLAEYYVHEGSDDPVIIEMPKGGYTPVFRQPDAAPDSHRRIHLGSRSRLGKRHCLIAGLAGLAIATAVIGWWWFQGKRASVPVAVLPFSNLSQDPANDYLADGLTDEIIRNLSVIDGLAVRSQTSSFLFKGKPRNVREAGKELEADYILEGSVLRSGEQLRINVQFIRARDDVPLWSGRFDRKLTDVLVIQDEISRSIVNSLRLKLGHGRRRYETSAEAYDFYLRARALGTQLGAQSSGLLRDLRVAKQMIGLFEQAIAKDPTFAPAYAGLAAAYAARSGDDQPDLTALREMRPIAEKAIQLDPLLAEAHAALGLACARDAQWDQSEKSFRRAMELDPNNSTSYGFFVYHLLLPLGRIEEAVQQVRAAENRDPLSPDVQGRFAYVLISAGRFDEAAAHCQKLSESRPCLARALLGQGRIDQAILMLEAALKEGAEVASELGYAYARAGRREEAERIAATGSGRPIRQALIFAALGDKDRAFEALDHAIPSGPARIGRDLTWPELASLRGDPRLNMLRKKVGLPQ
jgi:TolB-like protein/Flp pilus assembly protein TadD